MLRLQSKTFFGTRQKTWSSADLCVDLSSYAAGCAFPKHGHTDAFFCFVLNGVSEERADRWHEILPPDTLVYHPAGCEHSNQWHEEGRCMHIEFVPDFCAGVDKTCLSDPLPHIVRGKACDLARSIYRELLHVDSASGLAFEGLALVLLAETLRESCRERTPPRWLQSARARLHEEYISVPALKEIAADVGVHPTYLAASFQRHFGMSVGEYVRSRRIDRAREILTQSDQALSEVAQCLGFSDQSHFSRTFKKQTGLSPREYRRLFARGINPIQGP